MAWKKGQSGNPGGQSNDRPFLRALHRAIAKRKDDFDQVADRLLDEAKNGESWAIKELVDRTDGRAVQPVAATVDSTVNVIIRKPT